MSYVVLYDANVLYPMPVADLLIRVGVASNAFHLSVRWTTAILDEVDSVFRRKRPEVSEEQLARRRASLCEAVPDCIVEGYEHGIPGLELPDRNDRHVLAAAIHAGAQAIVTHNVKDFPPEALDPHHIEVVTPDDFLVGLFDLDEARIAVIVEQQVAALRKPPVSKAELLELFERGGLLRLSSLLRQGS